ncbi:MAG: NYN domain-containing protein [Patescibacteria group bacterium]
MIKHKDQRVGVFVDVGNMYHSAKNLYKARVNFQQVLEAAIAGRKLIRASAYVIKSQTQEEQSFFEALSKQGFDLRMKDLQVFAGGAKKGDWDVGMSVDAIKSADKLDVIVLVTGDGDYIPLVTYLQENKGCQVEVIGFGETTSLKLKEVVDDFIDLSEDLPTYLLREGRSGGTRRRRVAR